MPIKTRKHRGRVLQNTIHKLGMKINDVARRGHMSRGTVYNHFKQSNLDDQTLLKYGKLMRYDFSIHFPELIPLKDELDEQEIAGLGEPTIKDLALTQRKYYMLLEQHNALLKYLLKVALEHDSEDLKKEIARFQDFQFGENDGDEGSGT